MVPPDAQGHQLASRLFLADQLELVLGSRLGEEIVDPGLGGDGGGGQRVVSRDHHGADAHLAQLGETLADAALDDILEIDDAEQLAIAGHGQRRAAGGGDGIDRLIQFARAGGDPALAPDIVDHAFHRALADFAVGQVNATHSGLGGERHGVSGFEGGADFPHAIFLATEGYDRAAFGGFVGQRGEKAASARSCSLVP